MKKIFKIIKFIPLLVIVSLLSIGYRIFGGDDERVSTFDPFRLNSAEADTLADGDIGDGCPCDGADGGDS